MLRNHNVKVGLKALGFGLGMDDGGSLLCCSLLQTSYQVQTGACGDNVFGEEALKERDFSRTHPRV